MAWLAVNKDGTEWIMPGKPVRGWCGHWEYSEKVYVESEQGYVSIEIELPKGSVYKLLGKELTWVITGGIADRNRKEVKASGLNVASVSARLYRLNRYTPAGIPFLSP